MSTTAYLVYGTRLYYSTDGVTYSELVDVKELGSPGDPDAPEVDVTPLYDTISYRQFKAGLLTAGMMTFKQFWTKSRLTTLRGRLRTSTYWRVVFPDNANPASASKLEFQGYVKKCTPDPMTNPDDPIYINCEVKLTGEITFTEGS